jgi:YfiH family protein
VTGAAEPLLTTTVGAARVWCSGRAHGNVGDHVGDDPDAVARRRAAIAAGAGLPPATDWIWLRQVHGPTVHVAARAPVQPPEADAAVTSTRGLPLAIVTADCAPVVLATDDAVGVVHAGHRGLAAGVVEATIAALRARSSSPVRAFLAPCIRAEHYEFGAADLAQLVARFGPAVESRTATDRPALDIPAALRVIMQREGVEHFDDCGISTAAGDAYFSYRRDGATGRQVTVAMLP